MYSHNTIGESYNGEIHRYALVVLLCSINYTRMYHSYPHTITQTHFTDDTIQVIVSPPDHSFLYQIKADYRKG